VYLAFQALGLGVCVEEELRLAGVGVVALEHLVRLLMRCDAMRCRRMMTRDVDDNDDNGGRQALDVSAATME